MAEIFVLVEGEELVRKDVEAAAARAGAGPTSLFELPGGDRVAFGLRLDGPGRSAPPAPADPKLRAVAESFGPVAGELALARAVAATGPTLLVGLDRARRATLVVGLDQGGAVDFARCLVEDEREALYQGGQLVEKPPRGTALEAADLAVATFLRRESAHFDTVLGASGARIDD